MPRSRLVPFPLISVFLRVLTVICLWLSATVIVLAQAIGPAVNTTAASSVTGVTATLNGTVNPGGNATTVTFEYGLTTSYGSSVAATLAPIIGSNTLRVSAAVSGLTPSTTYHCRIKGVNSSGTSEGNDVSFATASTLNVPNQLQQTLLPPIVGVQASTRFGTSVAVDGIYTVIGAPLEDSGATDAGAVKVFHSNTGALLHLITNPSPATSDQFGCSVAVSGTRVLVGTFQDDTGSTNSGCVYVYDLASATPTVPLLTLNNPAPGASDEFGYAVSLQGSLAVVSAWLDDVGATNAGTVYVYDLNRSTPTVPLATLNNPSPVLDDQFGISVSISGSRVIVGAWNDDSGAANSGSAYVYDLTSSTPTSPAFTLNNPDPAANDLFGRAVGISGTRVIVGAREDDTGASNAGIAYVYELTSGTPTVPVFTLNNPEPDVEDQFGTSVAISGTRVIVGAYLDEVGVTHAGSIYVYDLSGGSPTTPVHSISNPSPGVADWFGYAVAIAGTRVVVGAHQDDAGATDAGSAYLYDLSSGTPAVATFTLDSLGAALDDRYGLAVAVSGQLTLIGSPREDVGSTNAGGVYVFDTLSGSPTVPIHTLNNPSPSTDDNFGSSVAVHGNRCVIGTPLDDTGASNSGIVYLYDLSSGTPTVPVMTFTNPVPNANDNFGSSVAIFGTLLVVGASEDDTAGADSGSVYVYDLASATPTTPAYIFNNPSPSGDDSFGSTVGISGRRIVVAAISDDQGAVNAGSVYVYDLNSGTPTVSVAELFNPTPASGDNFGCHAAISGSRVVVGALADDTSASDAGIAYVYDMNSGTPTVPVHTLNNPTPVASDNFGHSVGIAGHWVIVAASNDGTAATGSGSVYFYDLSGVEPTRCVQTLSNPSPNANDDFGLMMAVDGQRFVVGAPFDDTVAADKGSAYVFAPSSTAEIAVEALGGASLEDERSTVDFGFIGMGLTAQKTFKVTNLGGLPLTGLSLQVDGLNAADFTVGSLSSTTLAPGASTTFTISFAAGAAASRIAEVHLSSNDPDEAPFDITLVGAGQAGSLDLSYDPQVVGGTVTAVVELPDGKLMIGGQFDTIGGLVQRNLARLNGDGTLDTSFSLSLNGTVERLMVQVDGRLLIAGSFTITSGGQSRSNLARLNVDGTLDTSLVNGEFNSTVSDVVVQADGKMVVGGYFGSVHGTVRRNIARLNADGTLDTGYDPNADASVDDIVLQPDGKVIIGGQFNTVAGVTRNQMARIHEDGTLDLSYDPNVTGWVMTMTRQTDGKIIVGGSISNVGGTARSNIARLNADGTLDGSYNPNINSSVYALERQSDDKVIVGGAFSLVNGALARRNLLRLNADGTVDAAFNPEPNDYVYAIAQITGDRLLLGGLFTRLLGAPRSLYAIIDGAGANVITGAAAAASGGTVFSQSVMPDGKWVASGTNLGSAAGEVRPAIMRFFQGGDLDTSFNPNHPSTSWIYSTVPQADGKLVVQRANNPVRYGIDGAQDSSFSSTNTNNPIYAMALQPDGKVLVGGNFTSIWSTTRNNLARLNANGTLDTGFDPNSGGSVYCFAIQNDGKILVGGTFTTIGGVARNRLARLNADGTLDASFNPNVNNTVYNLIVQPDGKILVGGVFSQVGGVSRNRLARLNPDGTLDGFNPNVSNSVYALSLQTNGQVLIGGAFNSVGGMTRNQVARVNADGSLDESFVASVDTINLFSIAQTADGAVLLGGRFSLVNGAARNGLARLANSPSMQSLTAYGNAVNWVRAGSSPEVGRVTFESSIDGLTWTSLGNGTRTANGWHLTGLALPTGQSYQIRARGFQMTGGFYGGDSSIYETSITIPMGGSSSEMVVEQPVNTPLTDAISQTDFGGVNLGSSTELTYTLRNVGTADLTGLAVTLDGPHASEFSLIQLPASALAVGGSTEIRLRFTPQAQGQRYAALHIHSSDADEPSFDVALTGHGVLNVSATSVANVVGGFVNAFAQQSDGKLWVAGNFDQLGGAVRTDIARLNADGSLDLSVNHTSLSGSVSALFLQTDGKLLMGGSFSSAFGSNLRRLNADGSADTSFTPITESTILALAQQADGKLLVGGTFDSMGGQTRNRIARLHLDGTLDTSFDPNVNNSIESITVQADGKILIGGYFTTVGGVTRNRIARLNEDGTVDMSYDPNANSSVNAIQLRPDGSAMVVGGFTTLSGTPRNRMAVLNSDGTLEGTFNPDFNSFVDSFGFQPDGKILAVGSFTTVGGAVSNRIARLNTDGSYDNTWMADASSSVSAVQVLPDGKIMVAGSFTQINGVTRNRIARLTANGSLDTTLDLNCNGAVIFAVVQQPDGKTLIAGWFTHVNDVPRSHIARLNADGSLDTSFNPGANGEIYALALQPDGMILAGGIFNSIGGSTRNYIARLYPNGQLDTSFNPDANNSVYSLVVEPSGSILMGGVFTDIGGILRNRIARVSSTGVLDAGFDPNANSNVNALALQADGRIVLGGTFSSVGGSTRNRLARVNANGTLDTSFNPNINNTVFGVQLEADGRMVVNGSFTTVGGVSQPNLARLNTNGTLATDFKPTVNSTVFAVARHSQGQLGIAGLFTSITDAGIVYPRGRLALLNTTGRVDASFDPAADFSVFTLANMAQGRMLAGGLHANLDGVPHPKLVSFNPALPATQSLGINATATTVTWARGGSSPEVDHVTFESSTDGSGWSQLGTGTRSSAGWQLTGLTLPAGQDYYLRARGYQMTSGFYGGDGSVYESLQRVRVAGASAPELVVEQPAGSGLVSGSATFDFGAVPVEGSGTVTFMVRNTGTAALTGLAVTFEGAQAGDFTLVTAPESPLAALTGSATFTVRFVPRDSGSRSATLSLWSNDTDENPFLVSLTGSGTAMAPRATTLAATLVQSDSVMFNGSVSDRGATTSVSFDYGLTTSYGSSLTASPVTVTGGSSSAVSAPIAGLIPNTTYHFRVRAVNSVATTLGDDMTFTTPAFTAGEVDLAFDQHGSTFTTSVLATAVQPDGKLLVGAVLPGRTIARLNANGSVDASFTQFSNNSVIDEVVQPDGKVVIAGSFTSYAGTPRNRIARLNADGSLDAGFNPDANNTVLGLLPLANGRYLVGGSFTTMRGVARNRLALVNADGTLDLGFHPDVNSTVSGMIRQSDGKYLIGGSFTQVGGVARNRIARLNADGTLDASFNLDANNEVSVLLQQPDGKILLAGLFTTLGGATYNRLARLNADGSLDAGFQPGAINNTVYTLALQADGKILAGGFFTTVGNVARNRLARFHPEGTLDLGFNPSANDVVNAIALQADGKVILGGTFTTTNGYAQDYLARLNNDPATQTLTIPSANRIEWLRGGSSPEAMEVTFEVSNNGGASYTLLNGVTRIPGGWEVTGLSLPFSGQVRARARTVGGQRGGSFGLVESIQSFSGFSAPEIAVFRGASTAAVDEQIDNAGTTDFSTVAVGASSAAKTFTIQNNGTVNLTGLSLSLATPADYTFTQPLVSTLAPGATTTFTVTFAPTSVGLHPATLRLISNDFDESPFDLLLSGVATGNLIADNFTDRLNLGSASTVNVSGSNRLATMEANERTLNGRMGASVWAQWTAPSTGWFTIHTVGSKASTLLALYTGAPGLADLTLQGFNQYSRRAGDLNFFGQNYGVSRLVFRAEAGTVYHLAVGASIFEGDGEKGAFELHIAPENTPPVRLSNVVITPSSTDVTSLAQMVTVQVTVDSDAELFPDHSLTLTLTPASVSTGYFQHSFQIEDTNRISGSGTSGVYEIEMEIPLYVAPGLWPVGIQVMPFNAQYQDWTPQGADEVEDSYLIPPPVAAGLMVVNTGDIDAAAPVLVSVAGFPASVDVRSAPAVFEFEVTFSDDVSGLLYASNFFEGDAGGFGYTTASNLISGTNLSGVYRLQVTIPQGAPSGAYFPAFHLVDAAQNLRVYSDHGSASLLFNRARISPAGSDLVLQVTGTDAEIGVQGPGGAALTDGGPGVDFGNVGAPITSVSYDFTGSLDSEFVQIRSTGAATVQQTGGALAFHNAGAAQDAVAEYRHQSFQPSYNQSWSAEVTVDIPAGLESNITSWGDLLRAYMVVSHTRTDGTVHRLVAGGEAGVDSRYSFSQTMLTDTDGSVYVVEQGQSGLTTDATGRVKISFDATTKVLTAQMGGWTLQQVNLNVADWGMTANSTFRVGLEFDADDLAVPSATPLTFDDFRAGQDQTGVEQNFTLLNEGLTTLGGITLNLVGPHASDFRIQDRPEQSLGIAETAPFTVIFTPSGVGLRQATLQVRSTDPDESPFDISLTGTGGSTSPSAVTQQATNILWTTATLNGLVNANGLATTVTFDYGLTNGYGSTVAATPSPISGGADTGVTAALTGLSPGTIYHYRVRSVNTQGTTFGVDRVFTTGVPAAGQVDDSFNPDANGTVASIVTQPNGKIIVGGGNFTAIGGVVHNRLARLNANGSLESGFNPVSGGVNALLLQPDGKIVVGSGNVDFLFRVNVNGTIDPSFTPQPDFTVSCLAYQPDGKVLVGGNFSSIAGVTRNGLVRFNADDTVDASFNPNPNGSVNGIVVQRDGKLIISGTFSNIAGTARSHLARLNADGSFDASFNVSADNPVGAMLLQPDGKLVISGGFVTVNGVARSRIARVNADGSLDVGFNPNVVGTSLLTLALQADGKIILGGNFSTVGGVTRSRIARIQADGTLDMNFDPTASNSVMTLCLQADGKILVGGSFTSIGGQGRNRIARLENEAASQTLTIPDIGRVQWLRGGTSPEAAHVNFELSTDGGSNYIPLGAGSRINGGWELAGLNLPQVGQIRARAIPAGSSSSGLVESVQSFNGLSAPEIEVYVGANTSPSNLLVDGVAGFTFANTALNSPRSQTFTIKNAGAASLSGLSVSLGSAGGYTFTQPVQNTLAPGSSTTFTATFTPLNMGVATADLMLASTDVDENPFDIRLSGQGVVLSPVVTTLAVANLTSTSVSLNGRVTPNGASTSVSFDHGLTVGYGANVLATPNVITSGINNLVSATLTGLSPGTTYHFRVRATNSGGTTLGNNISFTTPLVTAGDVDSAFGPSLDGVVHSTVVQPDGKVLIAGEFTFVNGIARNRLVRVNADGTVDTTFTPNINGAVFSLLLLENGQVIVGGTFSAVGAVTRNGVARLQANGTLDTAFNPNVTGSVRALALQSDGKLILGGGFTAVGGATRNHIARLNADGSLDPSFNPSASLTVHSLVVQPDGRIVLGGLFETVDGLPRSRIARLNADGSLEAGFNPNVNLDVLSLGLQADGKIVLTGMFATVEGATRNRVARLNADGSLDLNFNPNVTLGGTAFSGHVSNVTIQTDGRMFISGDFDNVGGQTRQRIARLNGDGSVDVVFDPSANAAVHGIAIQADGRVIAGGEFTTVDGVTRNRVVRLFNSSSSQALTVSSAQRVQWLRAGTAPEAVAVTFDLSTDGGSTWSRLGHGSRATGGWELTGLGLPSSGRIRALARVAGGQGSASSGLLQSITTFAGGPTPEITVFNGVSVVAANERADNTGVFDMGAQVLSASTTRTFTVRNSGTAILTGLTVSLNTGLGEFSSTSTGLSSLNPGASTTFTVTFSPSVEGIQTRTVLIGSNDADENPFEIQITGHGQVPPVLTSSPTSRFIALGQASSLSASGTGTALQYQWLQNGQPVAGATSPTYLISPASLGHAGKWSARIFNGVGSVTSQVVNVGVVDTRPSSLTLAAGGTLSLNVAAAGAGSSYRWLKGGVAVPRGINPETKLVISRIRPDQAGAYTCEVTMPDPQAPLTPFRMQSGVITVTVTSAVGSNGSGQLFQAAERPIMLPFNPGSWIVGGEVKETLGARNAPTRFSITGLPAGVRLDPINGRLTGAPTVALNAPRRYALTITASNAAGPCLTPLRTEVLVQPLAGYTVGTFTALVDRDPGVNADLGGRLTLTISSTGSYSGRISLGTLTQAFTGQVRTASIGQDVQEQVTLLRSGTLPAWLLKFRLHRLTGALTGSIERADQEAVSVLGWRHGEGTSTAGIHNLRLITTSGEVLDSATGSLRVTVRSSGLMTWAGALSDGTTLTGSASVLGNGSVPLQTLLYRQMGSVQGWFSPAPASGDLDWLRKPTAQHAGHSLRLLHVE